MRKYYPYPTRDPIKNYFPLPNEIHDLGLTPGEFAVYSFLMQCEDRKTHQCYPSYGTISEHVQLSKNTVRKHVYSLVEKHFITVENTTVTTKRGQKRNGTLLYTIRPIEEAIRYRAEQQMAKAEEEQARQRAQAKLERASKKPVVAVLPEQTSAAPSEAGGAYRLRQNAGGGGTAPGTDDRRGPGTDQRGEKADEGWRERVRDCGGVDKERKSGSSRISTRKALFIT